MWTTRTCNPQAQRRHEPQCGRLQLLVIPPGRAGFDPLRAYVSGRAKQHRTFVLLEYVRIPQLRMQAEQAGEFGLVGDSEF